MEPRFLHALTLTVLAVAVLRLAPTSDAARQVAPSAGIGPSEGRSGNASSSIAAIGKARKWTDEQLAGLNLPPFRTINRRSLLSCDDPNPYLAISLDTGGPLNDVQEVSVTVSGVLDPSDKDWIAIMSPSDSNTGLCLQNKALYVETGDLSSLPLLCHYPVKFLYVSADPDYLSCANSQCQKSVAGVCIVKTCSGTVKFRLINIRTDVVFVFFTGGMDTPCVLTQSDTLSFGNPASPLYPHLSSLVSSGTRITVTWVSGNGDTQQVRWSQQQASSSVDSFRASDMCDGVPNPAADFGWHDPGYIHSAVMSGLSPSTSYSYSFGSDAAGWSPSISFRTPPAAGSGSLKFIIYGDMGKTEQDNGLEHYIQPGALGVINAVAERVANDQVDVVFHIGDISYATGFLVEWDSFLEMITPVASHVSYMTAIGNHERDFPDSGSYYGLPDSGGECGVPYNKYFPMPVQEADKPWYSIEFGPVHFTVMSTEHEWSSGSEQYSWIQSDLHSVDRTRTPWVIFAGHRPMYSSVKAGLASALAPSVDPDFVAAVEPLLYDAQVDVVFWGHVHNFERTCSVFQGNCAVGDETAPIHVVVGMAGFQLDDFQDDTPTWSVFRTSQYGYAEISVDSVTEGSQLTCNFVTASDGNVVDSFVLDKHL